MTAAALPARTWSRDGPHRWKPDHIETGSHSKLSGQTPNSVKRRDDDVNYVSLLVLIKFLLKSSKLISRTPGNVHQPPLQAAALFCGRPLGRGIAQRGENLTTWSDILAIIINTMSRSNRFAVSRPTEPTTTCRWLGRSSTWTICSPRRLRTNSNR